jgi:hypothetical protein
MDTDQGFEELAIREISRGGPELSHRQNLCKYVSDFRFVALLHPEQDMADVAGLKRLPCGL